MLAVVLLVLLYFVGAFFTGYKQKKAGKRPNPLLTILAALLAEYIGWQYVLGPQSHQSILFLGLTSTITLLAVIAFYGGTRWVVK